MSEHLRSADFEEAEFFRRIPDGALRLVRELVQERKLYPRRRLFSEGEPAEHLWVVQSGHVRLVKTSSRGKVTALETLGPGEMFGMWSADADERYAGTAEAVTEGRVWRLPRDVVRRLVDREPQLAAEMVRVISERLRDAHERLHSFAYEAVPARLARAILRVADGSDAKVTRRILAEACGTTVETTIRVLRRFEREGLIAGDVGSIRVLDAAGLTRIAEDAEAG